MFRPAGQARYVKQETVTRRRGRRQVAHVAWKKADYVARLRELDQGRHHGPRGHAPQAHAARRLAAAEGNGGSGGSGTVVAGAWRNSDEAGGPA